MHTIVSNYSFISVAKMLVVTT